jgi:maleate isomerase
LASSSRSRTIDRADIHRIGLAVPSSNTTIETEVPEMLARRMRALEGERFTFHSSRAVLHSVDEESLAQMVREGDRCARELSDARVEAIVYACLIALMAEGSGAHDRVEARMSEVAAENGSPAPVVSSAGALVRVLQKLGAERVAIITPYMRPLTELVERYLAGHDIDVVDSISLEVADNIEVGRLDAANLAALTRRLQTDHAEALVVSACVQMPSLPAIAPIEREVGIPVLSAATATVYELLQALGLDTHVPDAGALLAAETPVPDLATD